MIEGTMEHSINLCPGLGGSYTNSADLDGYPRKDTFSMAPVCFQVEENRNCRDHGSIDRSSKCTVSRNPKVIADHLYLPAVTPSEQRPFSLRFACSINI
jgi:hypothetical protein